MNIILNLQDWDGQTTAVGQIQPTAYFGVAGELRTGFTFINGWKKNQKKNHRL